MKKKLELKKKNGRDLRESKKSNERLKKRRNSVVLNSKPLRRRNIIILARNEQN